MKNLLVTSVFLGILFALTGAETKPLEVARGYLKMDTQGRTFFIQRPGTLEPGVRVLFENEKEERNFCKLKKVLPADCPIQEFSFVPTKGPDGIVMAGARLSGPRTAWHRLRAAETIFGIQPPKPTK
jgi:hypothetical protein